MSEYLDLERWPRRRTFDFFRTFERPHFSICTRLDVSGLVAVRQRLGPSGLTLAYHHLALRIANEQEPFRLRLEGGRARVHDVVYGSTAVLRPDDSITFATLGWDRDYTRFAAQAAPRVQAARRGEVPFDPALDVTSQIHFTSLPWLDFTSFTHARQGAAEDSVPKIAFGRIVSDGARSTMAIAIEVHHALMDGVHVGRFVQALHETLAGPLADYAGS